MITKLLNDKRELEYKLKEQVIAYNDLTEGAKKTFLPEMKNMMDGMQGFLKESEVENENIIRNMNHITRIFHQACYDVAKNQVQTKDAVVQTEEYFTPEVAKIQNYFQLEILRPELKPYFPFLDYKILKEYMKNRTLDKRTFRDKVHDLILTKIRDDVEQLQDQKLPITLPQYHLKYLFNRNTNKNRSITQVCTMSFTAIKFREKENDFCSSIFLYLTGALFPK